MEFDEYGRLKNPGIPSPEPVNTYTQTRNRRSSSTFFLWDWFNDFVISIGNFLANNYETIMGFMIWIMGAIGAICGIIILVNIWSNHNFIVATIITIIAGGLLYWVFLIIIGILYWVLSIILAILRFTFYNAYTLLLVIGICIGIVWYNNRSSSPTFQHNPASSSFIAPKTNRYRCTARTLNVRRQPYIGSPVIGKLHQGDYVEVYDVYDGFAHIKFGNSKAWASIAYLQKM